MTLRAGWVSARIAEPSLGDRKACSLRARNIPLGFGLCRINKALIIALALVLGGMLGFVHRVGAQFAPARTGNLIIYPSVRRWHLSGAETR